MGIHQVGHFQANQKYRDRDSMKIEYKKRRRTFNLIAMSDIAFLLLIFLVVTASFEYSQDIVPPTTAYVDELGNEYESIVIEINEDGLYSILSHQFLIGELGALLKSIPPNSIFKIFADKAVDFSFVSNITEALQKNGRYNVFFMLDKASGENSDQSSGEGSKTQ